MTKLLKLYEAMAKYVGLRFDNDGFLVVEKSTGTEPVQYDGNRILLPTNQNLKRNLVNEKIWFFHPLCEGAFEDESDIAQAYRQQLNIRLNMVSNSIIMSLLGTAAKESIMADLTPTQLELIVRLKGVDSTTVKNLSKYVRQSKFDRSVLNIFVSKGATKEGKRYPRLGSTNFDLYRSLIDNKGPEYFRSKDVQPLVEIYRYLFPEIDIENAYMYGSTSNIAPYTDALLQTARQITGRLNEIISIWSDYLIDPSVEFDHTWVDLYSDQEGLLKEIRMIPMQKGSTRTTQTQPTKKPLAQTPGDTPPWEPTPAPPPAPPHQPAQYQQPPMMPMSGMVPMPGMMPMGTMPQMQGMVPMGGMMPMGTMPQMPGMVPMGGMMPNPYQQQQPQQAVFVPTTNGMLVPMSSTVAPYFSNTGGGFSRPVR